MQVLRQDLAYAVRQHGVHRVPGLRGRVVARSGDTEVTAHVPPVFANGGYATRLTLPRSGDWTITIETGFPSANATLLPLRAVDAGTRPLPALADADRGRRLFVAKGCVTCHNQGEIPGGRVGPDLAGRRFPADYLARYLADPTIKPSQQGPAVSARMPDLELAPREIAALVAFINAERRVSVR